MGGDAATSWSMILGAAEGSAPARDAFARQYLPAVTAYFRARWRGALAGDVDDAVQDVFLDCFREGGALSRATPRRGNFRAYLYGVARIVALRHEERRGTRREVQAAGESDLDAVADEDPTPSRAFDRAWAETIMGRARVRHAEAARSSGEGPERRYELLRLRFEEGLPIREIAARWAEEPAHVHHEYARARDEFRRHLVDAVTTYLDSPTPEEAEAECARLLEYLRLE